MLNGARTGFSAAKWRCRVASPNPAASMRSVTGLKVRLTKLSNDAWWPRLANTRAAVAGFGDAARHFRRWRTFLSISCVVFSALGWFAPPLRSAEAKRTIVFFGDSLTAGYGLENPLAQAYPAIVQLKIDAAQLPWRVVNAGVSGETTAGGLRRVDWVLRQPVDLFVIALGGNDGLRGIDPAVTQQNLEQIAAHIRAKHPATKIVVAGMQMPPGMGDEYTRRYRAIFPTVAERAHATLLPFLLEGVGGRPDLNQSDGIHPTAAGHQLVAENVWKLLHPLL